MAAAATALQRPPAPDPAAADAPIETLSAAPPSAAAAALANAQVQADGYLAGERSALAANAPSTTAPTGLPAQQPTPGEAEEIPEPEGEAGAGQPGGAEGGAAASPSDLEEEESWWGSGEDRMSSEIEAPGDAFAEAGASAVASASGTDDEGLASTILAPIDVQALMAQTNPDERVDTSAGERPKLALTGSFDPSRAGQAAAPKDQETVAAEAQAASERAEDPGIDAIGPTVEPRTVTASAGAVAAPDFEQPPVADEILPEVAEGFDRVAAPQWNEATVKARADHDTAFAERVSDESREWSSTDQKIAAAEAKATSDQNTALDGARSEAAAATKAWDDDIAAKRDEYQGKRKNTFDQLNAKVEKRRTDGECEADAALAEGERQAREAETKTRDDVAKERSDVERKSKESDGFLDWLADAVSDLFDALANFVNKAFNALRKLVSKFIDAAKRAAHWAINKARDAINGFIDWAADQLEKAADVFLAFFPEARKKAKKWINKARNTAKAAVNKAADWLANKVDQLLDALGAALDFILSVYQRAFLAVLKVIEFLTVGWIEIMRGICRLVSAAQAMTDYFDGAVEQELLTQDLSEPLFFERTERETVLIGPPNAAAEAGQVDLGLIGQDSLRGDQIVVDQVSDLPLDKEFFANHPIPDGGQLLFQPEGGVPETEGGGGAATAGELGPAATTDPDGATENCENASDPVECKLTNLMNADTKGACEADSAPKNSQFPENQKFGPLTKAQRARFLLSQMGKGIKQWFSCNWGKVLAITIAALVVLVAAEILTGGLVTAALPIILEAFSYFMIGMAIGRAAPHIVDYLAKGWAGDIAPAGQSLAKALAIGAAELIFAVLAYITAGAFKVLAAAAKGAARVIGGAAKGVAKGAKALAGAAKAAGKRVGAVGKRLLKFGGKAGAAVIERGRIVFQGLERGFSRGVKTVRELAQRIGKYFRFKAFKIERHGKWIELWGEINPWILLATQDIEWVENIEKNLSRPGKTAQIGEDVAGRTASGKVVKGKLVGGTLERPDYRGVAELTHGSSATASSVVHHSLERQLQKLFPDLFTTAEINAGHSLRLIPKGLINNTVHLSGIRRLWDTMYRQIAPQLSKLGKAASKKALLAFRDFVDDYIRAMADFASKDKAFLQALKAGDRDLQTELLRSASDNWFAAAKPGQVAQQAIKAAGGI